MHMHRQGWDDGTAPLPHNHSYVVYCRKLSQSWTFVVMLNFCISKTIHEFKFRSQMVNVKTHRKCECEQYSHMLILHKYIINIAYAHIS